MNSNKNDIYTPGGTLEKDLVNPPSLMEVGSTDSGESQILHIMDDNPFRRQGLPRSPARSSSCSRFNPRNKQTDIQNQTSIKQFLNFSNGTEDKSLFAENFERSQKEQVLYQAWKKGEFEKTCLTKTIMELQQQIYKLNEQVGKIENNHKEIKTTTTDYETQDEELATDTAWIRIKNKSKSKKRKLNTTISPPSAPKATEKTPASQPTKKQMPAPPPMIIEGIKSYEDMYETIQNCVPLESFKIKLLGKDTIKVNVKDGDKYRDVSKMLCESSFVWHTYENKQIRPIKVMVKNLHNTCKPESIKNYLIAKGFKIIEVVNKRSFKTKLPLNMFMLTFDNEESIKNIYEISYILGCKVEVHPIKTSKLIPQCKKCQSYGHTQKYCAKEARCVKCAGKHHTMECKKPDNEQPKCVHCGEAHPANYRGCLVAKELQKIKNQKMKKPKIYNKERNDNNKEVNTVLPKPKIISNMQSYAEVLKKPDSNQRIPSQPQNDVMNQTLQRILTEITKIKESLKTVNNRIDKLENKNDKAVSNMSLNA